MSSKVQKRAASESMLFLSVVGGILILLNVLAAYLPSPRVDLTRNRLFSLADGSERVAANLDDRLEVTADAGDVLFVVVDGLSVVGQPYGLRVTYVE